VAIHDAYARLTPYELLLPDPEFADRHFPAVTEEADERGVDPANPAAFVMLGAVQAALAELREDDASPQSANDHGSVLYFAYRMWLAGPAVALVRAAERTLVITGTGIMWSGAMPELQEFVETTGIPFYTTPQGRGVIPEDHALSFLGARNRAWKEADVVLIVGTRLNFILGFGQAPRFAEDVKMIQVDIADEEIGRNRAVDVGIVGDAKMVLRQLTDEASDSFRGRDELAWIDTLRGHDQRSQEKMSAIMQAESSPMHPLRLCKEVRDFMDRDAIIVVDGHEILNFARQSVPTNAPGHRVNAGPNGCMGVAVPFGLGAKVAKPDTQVIVLSGDGSFGMNGMEIDTMVRKNIPAIIVISNNGGWAGAGVMNAGRDLGFSRYDEMATVFGAHGEFVERPEDIRPALERAVASGKPAVINVITDPSARSSTQSFAAYRANAHALKTLALAYVGIGHGPERAGK